MSDSYFLQGVSIAQSQIIYNQMWQQFFFSAYTQDRPTTTTHPPRKRHHLGTHCRSLQKREHRRSRNDSQTV